MYKNNKTMNKYSQKTLDKGKNKVYNMQRFKNYALS